MAASHTAEEFPASVDYLCREIYNWFSNSSLRKSIYKTLWDTLNKANSSNEKDNIFHVFNKLSGTRWLARGKVVAVILEHFCELRIHFSAVVNKEKYYLARQLNQKLSDETNYLY